MKSVMRWDRGVVAALTVALAFAGVAAEGDGGVVRVAERYGFDATDSTRFLEAALASDAREIVLEGKGSPWISAHPLRGHGNLVITFEKGAYLQAKRGQFKDIGDRLLLFLNCTNVVIRGAGPDVSGLRMWQADYADKAQYKPSEWRHGIALYSCVDVRIEGLSVNETGGDGVYISTAEGRTDFEGRRGSRNVTIRNCVFDRNYRQGISVIGVDGLLIEDVRLTNTCGTPPMAGIDFEPNHTWQCLRNIVMRRCHVEGNKGNGIEIAHGHFGADTEPNGFLIEDCTVVGNRHGFYYPTGDQDADQVSDSGTVIVRNTTFRETGRRGIYVAKRVNCKGSVTFENCRLENCGTEKPDESDLSLSISGHVLGEPDTICLRDVTVVRPCARPLLSQAARTEPYRGVPTVLDGVVTTVTAGKEERHVFDAVWRKTHCPYVEVTCPPALPRVPAPLDGVRVTDAQPGAMLPCAPAFLRGRGRFVIFHAQAGETVRFALRAAVIGKRQLTDTNPIEVYARGGKRKLAAFEPPRTREIEERTFVAPKAGFYELYVNTMGNVLALTACSVPVALDMTTKSVPLCGGSCGKWIASAPERLFVRVPAGQKFECVIGCPVGENVAFEITDPAGAVVTKVPLVEGVGRFQATAREASSWGVRFTAPSFGAFEDFQVGIRGVPGWLFLSPGRYWER